MTAAPTARSSDQHDDNDGGEHNGVMDNNYQSESELDRLKRESKAMVRLLKRLEVEETELRTQNEILAREALQCGFDPGMLEPPAPKRRGMSLVGGGGGGSGGNRSSAGGKGAAED